MRRGVAFSFKYAFEGIWIALHEEHNLFIQLLIGIFGLILGMYLKISWMEWIISIVVWGGVFSAELFNTAIEEIIDSFTVEYHPGAKKAKDISAAAVLIMLIVEIIIGGFIFLPHLI